MEMFNTNKNIWNTSGNISHYFSRTDSVSSIHSTSMGLVDVETIKESIGLCFMLLIDLLALVGNVAVIAVIIKTPQLRKFLFVLHLCIIDLLAALTIMPLGIASTSAIFDNVEFTDILCKTYLFLGVCFSSASILTISAINIERYYYIVHPMRYEVKMTVGLAVFVSIIIWINAVLAAMVPLFGWASRRNNPNSTKMTNVNHCSLQWNSGDYSQVFVIVFSMVCFVLPALIILVVYCSVFKVARIAALHNGPLPSWAASPRQRSDSSGSRTTIVTRKKPQKHPIDRTFGGGGKAALTLVVIGGQFLVCWLPYFAYHLHAAVTNRSVASDLWEIIVTWLAYTSFTVNPFFYGCLNRQIRAELIGLPKCFLKQSLDEQVALSSQEGSVEENFLQFLQRTSCVVDRRPSFSLTSSPRILLNQSTLTFRIPGQIPEETPELLEEKSTEDFKIVHLPQA
ncbi:G-protein coupled receptor 61-like [Latimeria chalumnae]